MAKTKFFSIGFHIPSDDFEFVQIKSNQTLLDPDVSIFKPSMAGFSKGVTTYNGGYLLSKEESREYNTCSKHWKEEIGLALGAGKMIIIYASNPGAYYKYVEDKARGTEHLERINQYDDLINGLRFSPRTGTEVEISVAGKFLASYWREFGSESQYQVELSNVGEPILNARNSSRIVGLTFRNLAPGSLLILPPLNFIERANSHHGATADIRTKSLRLATVFAELRSELNGKPPEQTPPDWLTAENYPISKQIHDESRLLAIEKQIETEEKNAQQLRNQIDEISSLRDLLFSGGARLEQAVIKALRAFGFTADQEKFDTSEFDVVFFSSEGRAIGEVEGKDNKAINIDKLSQLERNINEDFEREGVDEHAKGVLFGNAYRQDEPSSRQEFFTAKCISGARRAGAALVRTSDLFAPAAYLSSHPEDSVYATKCRQIFFQTTGAIAQFPNPPIGDLAVE